ncbi:MAG TPA: phosphopantetheine-binding protein, partial [Verrucomicrobiae bacterium]|nr:phosphopantetheine-binding protein [Verrucomicrobiae bacterium]
RVQGQVAREEELVIAPEFFHALRKHLPRITHVEIQLKPGRFHNEVTRFRYDVTLHVDKAVHPEANIVWLDNAPESLTPGIITEALSQNGSGYAGIRRVPNARLVNENLALAWMSGSEGPETLGELRAAAQAERKVNAVDPENVLTLAREAGCAVDIIWTDDADDTGAFDVIFRRSELPSPTISSRNISSRRKAWAEFANQPAKGRPDTKLVNQLRTHLKQRLPAIMVPSAFVVLDAMPLTPNGKVDRRALPDANVTREEPAESFIAPRTSVEEALAGIWREILGLDSVGVEDDFFKLGGHSLLATQLVSRLREVFKIELPLRSLFEAPTIAKLARQLVAHEAMPGIIERTARILNQLEAMSAGELEAALEQRKSAATTGVLTAEPANA